MGGITRFAAMKLRAGSLKSAGADSAGNWLASARGEGLTVKVKNLVMEGGLSGKDVLFLSTGSTAAPYTLALARLFGSPAATVMTPSILGTDPFDFAIVPAHDSPPASENVFVTLGAPNAIDVEKLEREAESLLSKYAPVSSRRWGILIGGDDANYRITGPWIRDTIGCLAGLAHEEGVDLYVTTSRRTSPDAEKALLELAGRFPVFRMLLLASIDPSNPVPGILGGCEEVFCTEDSVSMVSEAATAGFVVRLLRVERKGGPRLVLQNLTRAMVKRRWISSRFLWGAPRFDAMLEGFLEKGLGVEGGPCTVAAHWKDAGRSGPAFNEAKEAAEWILARWGAVARGEPGVTVPAHFGSIPTVEGREK